MKSKNIKIKYGFLLRVVWRYDSEKNEKKTYIGNKSILLS